MKSLTPTAVKIIRVYQAVQSVKHQALLSVFGYVSYCKHQPSCSEYAIHQLREHGTILGSIKAAQRIVRCW